MALTEKQHLPGRFFSTALALVAALPAKWRIGLVIGLKPPLDGNSQAISVSRPNNSLDSRVVETYQL